MIGSRFILDRDLKAGGVALTWSSYHNKKPLKAALTNRRGGGGWSLGRKIKQSKRYTLAIL